MIFAQLEQQRNKNDNICLVSGIMGRISPIIDCYWCNHPGHYLYEFPNKNGYQNNRNMIFLHIRYILAQKSEKDVIFSIFIMLNDFLTAIKYEKLNIFTNWGPFDYSQKAYLTLIPLKVHVNRNSLTTFFLNQKRGIHYRISCDLGNRKVERNIVKLS